MTFGRSLFSRARGSLALSVAVMAIIVTVPSAALATHTPNHGDPCRLAAPATVFADYDTVQAAHRASVDCAYYRAIMPAAGTSASGEALFLPQARITRAEMAQLVVNALIAAGHDERLPSGAAPDAFDDTWSSTARVAINRLARAGIVGGTGYRVYSPNGLITRQQMATFLVQAANFVVDPDVAGDGFDRFTDVSVTNVHKRNIENGADAGLFQGTGPTQFAPGRLVSRQQMASFLVNLLRRVFDENRAPIPFNVEGRVDNTNVAPGATVTGRIAAGNLRSVAVSGCGVPSQLLSDLDEVATWLQFSVTIPSGQTPGACTLFFTVTFTNNAQQTVSVPLTVRSPNTASVTLNQSSVTAGGQITGEVTGTNLSSARVSGCGFNSEVLDDRNGQAAGFQYQETVPSSQPAGTCTLTFRVTYLDGRSDDLTRSLTVTSATPSTARTTRPELLRAEIVSTTTTAQASGDNPAGTVVRYHFDEPVGSAEAAEFLVYRYDATRIEADVAQAQSQTSLTVLARFNAVNTPALAAELSLAAVDHGAVTDTHNQTNPEGAAPLAATSSGGQAGVTAAPDLTTVSGFRQGAQNGTTAVDFWFDEAAYTVVPTAFRLVLVDSTVVGCTGPAPGSNDGGGGSAAGGNGSSRLTVVCPNPQNVSLNTSTVARGYVGSRGVSDAPQTGGDPVEGNANALQAQPVAGDGATNGPDLDAVQLQAGAGANDADVATFVFDEALDASVAADRFVVYDTTGREFSGLTATRGASGGSSQRTVTVQFPATAFDAVVGAAVRDSAVTTPAPGGLPNRADELGVTIPVQNRTPGFTQGPDLMSIALATQGNGSSQVTTATYTFDEELNTAASAAVPSRFFLFLSDGQRLTCTGVFGSTFVVGSSGTAWRQVSCSRFQIGGTQATAAQVASAVSGSVDHQAVEDAEAGTKYNPEGGFRTTGGTGTPQ